MLIEIAAFSRFCEVYRCQTHVLDLIRILMRQWRRNGQEISSGQETGRVSCHLVCEAGTVDRDRRIIPHVLRSLQSSATCCGRDPHPHETIEKKRPRNFFYFFLGITAKHLAAAWVRYTAIWVATTYYLKRSNGSE